MTKSQAARQAEIDLRLWPYEMAGNLLDLYNKAWALYSIGRGAYRLSRWIYRKVSSK